MGSSKRFADLVLAVTALVVLSPVMVAVGLLVICSLGRPVLFRQTRPGLHGQPFVILKFRTMASLFDSDGKALPDGLRMHPLGTALRRSSLDELPELLNVLKGDMSLVGPRPLLMDYLPLYTPEQARRHEVKPGITGWVQVNGRNALSWEDKFRLDIWYVDHWSLWLDLKILLLTVWKVVKREGISAAGFATMPEFQGSKAGVGV